jgi:hypothetical protein
VTFALGVFDLFTYLVPGSLYLALGGYLTVRLGWVDPAVFASPGLALVVAALLLGYLLGYLAYPVGELANKLVPRQRRRNPIEEFRRRVPSAANRDYLTADRFLLLAGVQLHDRDAAADVNRTRATGLMLRNSAPPVLLGGVVALVTVVVGPNRLFAACCAVLLAAAAPALVAQARRLAHMASMKTLELSFWLPDVDERYR